MISHFNPVLQKYALVVFHTNLLGPLLLKPRTAKMKIFSCDMALACTPPSPCSILSAHWLECRFRKRMAPFSMNTVVALKQPRSCLHKTRICLKDWTTLCNPIFLNGGYHAKIFNHTQTSRWLFLLLETPHKYLEARAGTAKPSTRVL